MTWTVNPGRVRAPFSKGTLIDVVLRADEGSVYQGNGINKGLNDEGLEIHGVRCGIDVDNWQDSGVNGDVLKYRLHEAANNEGDNNGEE